MKKWMRVPAAQTALPVQPLRRTVLLAGLAGVGLSAAGVSAAGLAGVSSGAVDTLFSRSFTDLDGREQSLAALRGEPLLLNFWASWCAPCVKEMPDLDVLHQRYPQVHVVGLAVDTVANVRRFGEKVQVSYPLLIAGHGGIALMKQLGNPRGGLPFTLLFGANGRIDRHWLGQIDPQTLETVLAALRS